MKLTKSMVAVVVGALFSSVALAQTAESEVQRNINQQERIEQGLKSGALTPREASGLEREEGRVERMQAKALRDGRLSPAEAARIERAQDRVSRDINRESHDSQRGDPNSASSRRMQAEVGRDIGRQRGIEHGLQSGRLDNRQAAFAERRESQRNHVQQREHRGGHAGHGEMRHERHDAGRQGWQQHGGSFQGGHAQHANYTHRRR